ncbi:MAG: NAD(P)/FAD-dependent oxidoreductase [Mycolicibacterium hassiacum]|mgnify:CR=1 FL=1|jgi:cation diffusion facilitator CzcD-associated flavoprotein CzcO|uniref:flavin-containing monooxygenase n=1 Tax=Mycolicibacterium hassiacum TaxID=46351 RepID=UPI000DB36E34|nr:NAD(P)/FAD-dependent oxidoreductase [Mycolicibacterium hassiacum]MBX5487371.1 NAD(P)/FAD-dependent oxidoreductase [Mycolicibacterium hassiacum]PZN16085.1 MAG: 4-hydroxyacetophenone monooxygenase [Mycolicibacterium hassiacum]
MTVAAQTSETQPDPDQSHTGPVHTRALIIGTGFSGLGMGIALQRRGVEFLILEKADDIGGTWRDNTYPGCACDIPSHMYSFSFEPKADWTHMWSYQPEILEYMQGVTNKYGLRRYIRFGSHVDRAYWDDTEMRWHVFTTDGREFVAQFLISGIGGLHIPLIPDFEGIDEYQGRLFHSAQWDHSVDLTGKRVAVIGTGASAIQIVPAIIEDVAALHLYQRTPAWVMPRPNNPIPPWLRTVFSYVPGTRWAMRAAIYWAHEVVGFAMTKQPRLLKIGELLGKWNIRRWVKDPELRRKLTPSYRAGCKRILNSNTYYRAVADPKTEVITDGIARFTRTGIVAGDGTERDVDVVVCATGFHVTDAFSYLDIKGRAGEDLVDRWNREGISALRGITVTGMPNLFFLLGPNTALGHNSVVFMIESQIRYVAQAIAAVDRMGAQALEPTKAAQDAYNEKLQRELAGTVWNTGGCRSWYLDEHGVNRTLWSGMTWQYWLATRRFDPSEYHFLGFADSDRDTRLTQHVALTPVVGHQG